MLYLAFCFINLIGITSGDKGNCYGDLGCLPITPDFYHPIYRPVNVDPQTPEEIDTTFHLFTKKNRDNGQLIDRYDEETIQNSNYDHQNPTKFLVHGFAKSMEMLMNITKEILRFNNVNVIMVDWSKGAHKYSNRLNDLNNYIEACANTRVVGRQIGNLIKLLMNNFQANADDMHLIGHSLGAQIVGYAGQWMNETKVGEITGLDPAGPFYQGMPPSVVLDPTDGKFVNAIHSNSRPLPYTGFGSRDSSGHVDFYPDGGRVVNECDDIKEVLKIPLSNVIKGTRDYIYCSHEKVIDMYSDSVNYEQCRFTAFACDDMDSFREAKCYKCERPGYDCRPMGYYTDQYPYDGLLNKKFFLTTTDEQKRLCAFHWVVELKISDQQKAVSGDIYLSAIGEKYNLTKRKINTRKESFSAGETYSYLLTFERNPGRIEYVEISWTRSLTEYINGLLWTDRLTVDSLTLIPIEFIDQNERNEKTEKFCDRNLENMKPDKTVTAVPKNDC